MKYKIGDKVKIINNYDNDFKIGEIAKEELKKLINKMAEDLTTPIHDKEWIINYYLKEIEDED